MNFFTTAVQAACLRFSSSVSQRAVAGRSVRVKYPMIERTQVMIPSTRKIISHRSTDPIPESFRIPLASRPPKAPALNRVNSGEIAESCRLGRCSGGKLGGAVMLTGEP